MIVRTNNAQVELLTPAFLEAGTRQRVRFLYRPAGARPPGACLWLFYGVRQWAGAPQDTNPEGANYVTATAASGRPVASEAYFARTLDLYPRLPEFLHVVEFRFEQGLPAGDAVTLRLGDQPAGWQAPTHPIDAFGFWFLESEPEGWRFRPTGYKTYRAFCDRDGSDRVPQDVGALRISIVGQFPPLPPAHTRRTPGILWGDIHGMAFNQRPLDDYYRYARDVACLDFAAAMLFSYNVCVDGVWQEVVDAAARWSEPGRFLGIVGVESGTVPDGSHRNAYYLHAENVPPIFCEDRPPAHAPSFVRRLHPDTVFCPDLDAFYATVARHAGIVTGHFHTTRYEREALAEIWQKQAGCRGEEARIYKLLNDGLRLGIIAGSDTHDSMPGNPEPEPWCPQPAGLMAVLADEVSAPAIGQAMSQRRVYGTTGARIALRFEAAGAPMGCILPAGGASAGKGRRFDVRVEGTAPLSAVELVRDGTAIQRLGPDRIGPDGLVCEAQMADPGLDTAGRQWYLLKVTQADGHRAWSSPIWFE